MKDIEDAAKKYFEESVTDRERAIFEGAITLGAIYHQFVGTPVSRDEEVVKTLEKAISRTMEIQPYKEDVKVRIDLEKTKREKTHPYDYETLRGRHMDVSVVARYGKVRATLRMRFIKNLDYTLMYVERIEET